MDILYNESTVDATARRTKGARSSPLKKIHTDKCAIKQSSNQS
ncbi:hypothetical protein N9A04_00100 [Rickettsiales bacterium]|nr:hypothetical protein [Rickettsiales bacterium]